MTLYSVSQIDSRKYTILLIGIFKFITFIVTGQMEPPSIFWRWGHDLYPARMIGPPDKSPPYWMVGHEYPYVGHTPSSWRWFVCLSHGRWISWILIGWLMNLTCLNVSCVLELHLLHVEESICPSQRSQSSHRTQKIGCFPRRRCPWQRFVWFPWQPCPRRVFPHTGVPCQWWHLWCRGCFVWHIPLRRGSDIGPCFLSSS